MSKTSLGQVFLNDNPMKSHLNLGAWGKGARGCGRSCNHGRGRVKDWLPTRRGEAGGKGGSHIGVQGWLRERFFSWRRYRWRMKRRETMETSFKQIRGVCDFAN